MKPKSNPFRRSAALAASIVLTFGTAASAGTLYWDGNGTGASGNPPTTGAGGGGTWTSAGSQWWTGTAYQAWNAAGGQDIADFRGTAGTVAVSGTVNVNQMLIRTNSYVFNSGTINFTGTQGILDVFGTSSSTFSSNATGNLKVQSTGNAATLANAAPLTITGSTNLTSFELALSQDYNHIILGNAAALGTASSTVKLTKGALNLGTSASTPLSYNAWATDLAGGTIRGRFAVSTWNGATSLSASSQLMTRNASDAKLVFSNTGTINLNDKTLSLMASSTSLGIELNGVISGTGNLVTGGNAFGGSDNALGTATLGAANTFSGTAKTTPNLGTLALNHVDALQNATLDTDASGTQAVTFVVAGTNTYNIGALTGSDALAIGANTISVGNKAGSHSFGADIGGAGGLTKVGANSTQSLTAVTNYSGATSITNGTLALSGSGAISGSSGINISGGTLSISGSGAVAASIGITIDGGTAKLLHTGSTAVSSVVTLTQGTLTGTGTVNTVNVGAGTGGIITNNNGVAGAALNIGTLTLTGGAAINLYSSTTAAALNVTNLINDSASNAVTLTANNVSGWTNGSTYNIIDYGTLGGTGAYNFNKVVNNKSARQSETWNDDTVNGIITLAINGDNPRWMGDTDGKWNLTTTNNWKLVTGGSYTTFLASDDVLFDDNATGTTTIDIDSANVAANTTAFNNTSKNYSLTGSFGISTGNLTKNGTGDLSISTNNTYSGPTTLNAGVVTLSGSGTLGSGSALSLNGAALDLGGTSQTTGAVSITAAASSGDTLSNGSLTSTSYAVSNSSGNVGISANLLANASAGFTKSGTGTTTLSGANTWTGTTAINDGSMVLSGSGTLGSTAALTLGGGSLNLGGTSQTVGAVSVTAPASSGDTISNGSLTGTSYAASNTSGDAIISANLLANGAAGFTMSGAGTVTLSGSNTYTGATSISAGTLKAGSSNAFTNDGVLSMSGTATFDLGGNNASFTNLSTSSGSTITTSGSGTDTDTLTISGLTATSGALFTDGTTRKLAISLDGTATLDPLSNGSNTFSGGLSLLNMRLGAVNNSAITGGRFGKGTITVGSGSQLYMTSAVTISNDFIVNANDNVGSRTGTVRIGYGTGVSSTLSGTINANLAVAGFGSDGSAGAILELTGKLTGTNGFSFFKSSGTNAWTAILNNSASNNDYAGTTTIGASTTVKVGTANQIPNGTGTGIVSLAGILDLNGLDETINGLTGAGTVDNVTTGTSNILTIGDNDSTANTFSGLIKNTTGSLSLIKIGTGTQTLSGANTFTGGLAIKNGTIIASTVNTALGGSSAGVANGLGTVTLGDTTGTNAASLLVSTTGLNFANPIVLATNGNLSLGNTGTAISTTFSGGVTGNNDLTIISNATTGTIGLTTAAIDNVGKVTNTGAGSGTTTISSSIGANVTEVIENSATSTLSLSGNNSSFLGDYSINNGRMAVGGSFAANAASEFNLGAITVGSNNTTLSVVNSIAVANDINVRAGNSGTKTITLGTSADIVATLSGKVTLDDNLILDATGVGAGASLTLSGNILDGTSGAKGLTKNSAGVVILSGTASDFSGSVAINAGELRIANASALGNSTSITVNAGRLSLDGGITTGSGKSLTTSGNGSNFFGGLQSVSGINEWAGSVLLGANDSRIGARKNATLVVSGAIGDGANTFNLVVRNENQNNTSGAGNATTITELSGINTYGGNTQLIAGVTRLGGGDNRLPTGTILQFGGSGANAKFDMNGRNQEVAGLAVMNTTNDTQRDWNANELTNSSGTLSTLTVNTAADQTFGLTPTSFTGSGNYTGIITGNIALEKSGSAKLTLSGANTYTGDTTITAGTLALTDSGSIANSANLIVNGTLDVSGLTAGIFTVGASQTLSGDGTITATGKTLEIAGTHAAGNSPGLQTVDGNLSYTSTSIFEWDLAANVDGTGARGTDFDAVDVSGDLTIDADATFKVIMNTGVDFTDTFWTSNQTFNNIWSLGETATLTSGWTDTSVSVYNTSNALQNISAYGSFTINGSTLTWSAVPEPTSALVGLLIGAGLLRRRRVA